ncbi:MAG: hypothetical protein R2861_07590 [Desulfobacterales bacterium]
MVHEPEKFFEFFVGERMVKGGGQIQEKQGGAINAETDNAPGVFVLAGKNHQNRERGNAENCAIMLVMLLAISSPR